MRRVSTANWRAERIPRPKKKRINLHLRFNPAGPARWRCVVCCAALNKNTRRCLTEDALVAGKPRPQGQLVCRKHEVFPARTCACGGVYYQVPGPRFEAGGLVERPVYVDHLARAIGECPQCWALLSPSASPPQPAEAL